jgi:alpha-1,6-mannosyltransferase
MKSLHLTNAYHPTSGGIRTWYHQVLAAAGEHGWTARLVVPGERSSVETVTPHARIHHVAAPRAPVFDRRYRLVLPHRYLLPGGALRRILLAEQPDLVEIADKYALNWLAGVIRKGLIPGLKRPVIVGFSFERMDDNVAAFLGNGAVLRPLAPAYLQRCYWPMFDAHIGASDYTAAELRPAAARDPKPLYVQPCGVQAAGFDPSYASAAMRSALLEACGGGSDTCLLLYAGRLSPEKNTDLLGEMMADLQQGPGDFRLVVAGSGPLLDSLRRRASTLDRGRITFWGQVQDRGVLASLYATCDAFVHPNPREPFGIAPLEAMASGCPVVLPDSGGVRTYADDTNAWIAPATAAAFAQAVRAMRADPDTAAIRRRHARETALRYDTSRMVERLFAIYTELVRNGADAGSEAADHAAPGLTGDTGRPQVPGSIR